MSGYIPWVVIAALFIVLIMAYALYLEDKSEKLQLARKRSCRGLISVLENCPEDSECTSQIQMLYKRLSEQYSSINENFRSATEMIEDLICSVDTTDQVEFKKTFGVELPIQ
jgi:Tfp pilus assembly protein PilO